MSWLYLVFAGCFEVVWATSMKLSHGFSNLKYSIVTLIGMIISFFLLSLSLKELPMSIAYSVWTGIGAIGSIIIGVMVFKDQLKLSTGIFIVLLVISLIGIKITASQ